MGANRSNEEIWVEFSRSRHPALRDELILAYIPLVRFVVSRLGIPSMSVLDQEDLVSFGVIGLINAIDRYEPRRGIRFEAFATPRIRGAVIDQLRAINWFPRSAVKRIRRVEEALAELEQRLGRSPSEEEIAAEMEVPLARYRHMAQEANTTIFSLDAPLASLSLEDDTTSVSELLEDVQTPGPADQLEYNELLALLNYAAGQLPPRERQLLTLYYQKEMTMKEISAILHVSESRVCQLHMQAIARLRTAMDALSISSVTRRPKQRQKERSHYHHARLTAQSR
jgi:RNA polymerase sigma factor for flagellar operon FliA